MFYMPSVNYSIAFSALSPWHSDHIIWKETFFAFRSLCCTWFIFGSVEFHLNVIKAKDQKIIRQWWKLKLISYNAAICNVPLRKRKNKTER